MGAGIKGYKFADVLAKAVGIGGLGLVAYDSHKTGRIEAPRTAREAKAKNLEEHCFNDMKLDGSSAVKSAVKKRVFQFYADENITSFFTTIAGYVKGFGRALIDNVIPLGLSVGALLSPPKGIASRMFGAGLLIYGGVYILQQFTGIGKPRE